MSIRYVARPRAMFDDREQHLHWHRTETPTVFEPDETSRKTGLVDVRGNPIYALCEIGPIGFRPVKER